MPAGTVKSYRHVNENYAVPKGSIFLHFFTSVVGIDGKVSQACSLANILF